MSNVFSSCKDRLQNMNTIVHKGRVSRITGLVIEGIWSIGCDWRKVYR